MKQLAEILAAVDRGNDATNPEAQKRVAREMRRIFIEHSQRLEVLWDDVATEYATPLVTYLAAKSEAMS